MVLQKMMLDEIQIFKVHMATNFCNESISFQMNQVMKAIT